jgi:UDP-N-acetylmuramoyl-tripeptide--D-alanyl-D-alanine ligase
MSTLAATLGVELVAVAEPSYGIGDGIEHVPDREAALASLRARNLGAGDAVLVKASRVAELERVAAELRHDGR